MAINAFEVNSIFFTSLMNIEEWTVIPINRYGDYVLKNNNSKEKILVEIKAGGTKTPSISGVTNKQIIFAIEKQLQKNGDDFLIKKVLVSSFNAKKWLNIINENPKITNDTSQEGFKLSLSPYKNIKNVSEDEEIHIIPVNKNNNKNYNEIIIELKKEIKHILENVFGSSNSMNIIRTILLYDHDFSICLNKQIISIFEKEVKNINLLKLKEFNKKIKITDNKKITIFNCSEILNELNHDIFDAIGLLKGRDVENLLIWAKEISKLYDIKMNSIKMLFILFIAWEE